MVAVLFASFAIAQDYPVVTSVDELKSYPEGTVVLYENIEVVKVKIDYGYYEATEYCLPDESTVIDGNFFPVPASFSAVGSLVSGQGSDGSEKLTFEVQELVSVSNFFNLGELINFASNARNAEIVNNSPIIKSLDGSAIVTCIYDNYVFYYTLVPNNYGGKETIYGIFNVPNIEQLQSWDLFVGAELFAYDGFYGSYAVPTQERGCGCFNLSQTCYFTAYNWEPYPIQYNPSDMESVYGGYIAEGQALRFAPGGNFVERDGKYFYENTVTIYGWDSETYEDIITEELVSMEIFSVNPDIDLANYAGTVSEQYLCGVWDCTTSDNSRLLLTEFMGTEKLYENIAEFLAVGSQYEEEIPAVFNNPMTVTYKYDDGNYKFIIIVEDESGALALDFGEAIDSESYAAVQAINVGDVITGVKGFAQFYCYSEAPNIDCAVMDWDTYEVITYLPTVQSTGATVEPAYTVTVSDMLNEWADCQNYDSAPKIANNVVRLVDVQVVEVEDEWGDVVKYLVQGKDTMELSNLWGEDKMNFQTYERNNMIGIADYCCINSNYIYQFMPLSQEHITDASQIIEVTTLEELQANEGNLVVVKNATVEMIKEMYYSNPFIFGGEVYVAGFNFAGTFDLYGLYADDAFSVYEVKAVHAFATISDMNGFLLAYPEAAGQSYNVSAPVVVTHVEGENVFVQFDGRTEYGQEICMGTLLQGLNIDVKQGDMLQGIKGISNPCQYEYVYYDPVVTKGSNFVLDADAEITILSSDNEINYGSAHEYAYMMGSMPYLQGAAVKIIPVGAITEEGGRYYYSEIDYTNDEQYNQIEVQYVVELVSSVVDLSEWVGATLEGNILGVIDYMNTSDDVKVYVHGLASNVMAFDNIAALVANGPIEDWTVTVTLANPAVVTYVYNGSWSQYITVQDATGAILIALQHSAADYAVGDEVSGIKGKTDWWDGSTPMISGYNEDSYVDYELTILSQGNVVEPAVATIAELNEEYLYADEYYVTPTTWVSKLVRLEGVEFTTAIDKWGEEWPCLKQGEDVLFVVKKFGENFGLSQGDVIDVTGVIDYNKMNVNNLYTICPRSAADINVISAVEGVVAQGNIYLDAAYQVVAPGAVAVALYDINGRQVATTDAAGLAEGVYVVRATYADGNVVVAKVVR